MMIMHAGCIQRSGPFRAQPRGETQPNLSLEDLILYCSCQSTVTFSLHQLEHAIAVGVVACSLFVMWFYTSQAYTKMR